MGPLNPPPPASESEPEDVTKVENTIEHKDETALSSIHEVGESSTASFLREDSDGLLPVRSSVEQRMAAIEKVVEKLGNAEDKVKSKKLKKELEEARLSNTFLRMQNERVERDLYWTRVQAHEFYQEMTRRGFVFEERPNEAIDVPDAAPVVRECTFVGFMKCSPTDFHGIEGAVKLQRWFDKTKSVFGINECVEGKKNNQKQRNARAMITAPPDGKVSSGSLPLCERCFTRHVVPCTIKCYKCGKVGHKERNRCSKKVKQEEAEEVRGRAYAIKDAEPKGPNVVT
nr:hypothetical protein [Tanacetum cinerariifolium]